MAINYETIYPKNSEKSYEVKITFTSVQSYMQIVEELEDKGFLTGEPEFVLSASGIEEDRLTPVLKKKGYKVKICSAGDRILEEECASGDTIVFCLYGFSQRTYDRLCPYSYDNVRHNIEETIRRMRAASPSVRLEVEYVMYQFNMSERFKAGRWAEENGLAMRTKFAGLDEQSKRIAYLTGEMSTHDIITAAKKYFFSFLDDIDERKPQLIRQYAGREPVLADEAGRLLSEWDFEIRRPIELSQVHSYENWREYNQEIFYDAAEEPYALRLWIWNRSE